MGLFSKLFGLAVAVGAGYAAVKVANRYEENKQKELLDENFEISEQQSAFQGVKKAAGEVYCETADKVKTSVKTKAEEIGIDTEEMSDAFSSAGVAAGKVSKAVANASVQVANKVKKEAPVLVGTARVLVSEAGRQVKDVADKVGEKFAKNPPNADGVIYVEDDCADLTDEFESVENTEDAVVTVETEVDPFKGIE